MYINSMQYTWSMDALTFDIGRLINRIHRLSLRTLDARLKVLGISATAIPVLALLKSGQAMTQKELADSIGTEQPTMAQLLNRMERDGLVSRIPNPADGRSAHVELTEHAIGLLPRARRTLEESQRLVQAGMTQKELATLQLLLQRYLANVESHQAAKD